MYLMRIGAAGSEKPVVRLDDETYVDVSDVVHDFDEAFFGSGALATLSGTVAERAAAGATQKFAGERIGAPIARPHQILCIGLNYRDHAAETGQEVPAEPILFTKSPNTLIGPDDDVRIPRGSTKPDWEVELGIVIGKRTSYLDSVEEAKEAIAGYCVVNDVSERVFQMERNGQWSKGKSSETFNPAGPWLVTPDEIDDVLDLGMWLDVSGTRRQTGSTSTMVFDPFFLVHYLSQFLVLEPGDLINTGTPPGVGMGFTPPVWLKPGDVMELGIEGLGSQRQTVIAPPMKAFVLTAPREWEVREVAPPVASPGSVVIDVQRVGVCGTDVEFYTGEMQYLHDGFARFPMRLGHEWMGTVSAVGADGDETWLGLRVTGDTMLGCGHCRRCLQGNQHVCEFRFEVGIRGGFPGALAEQLAMPVTALHALPDSVDDALGALVEPGGNALRSVWGANLAPGDRVLVLGPGTIGLLAAMFARSVGAEVHLMGRSPRSLDYARTLGFDVWTEDELPELPWDAVIDASNAPALPAQALQLVEPAKRVVYVGLAGSPSPIDTRTMALKDVTSVGILSASPGLAGTIDLYASGAVDPRELVAATVGLDGVGAILAGDRPDGAGLGPKMHVDPRI